HLLRGAVASPSPTGHGSKWNRAQRSGRSPRCTIRRDGRDRARARCDKAPSAPSRAPTPASRAARRPVGRLAKSATSFESERAGEEREPDLVGLGPAEERDLFLRVGRHEADVGEPELEPARAEAKQTRAVARDGRATKRRGLFGGRGV